MSWDTRSLSLWAGAGQVGRPHGAVHGGRSSGFPGGCLPWPCFLRVAPFCTLAPLPLLELMTPAGMGPSAITGPFRASVGASVKREDTSSPAGHQAMRLHSGQRHPGVSSTHHLPLHTSATHPGTGRHLLGCSTRPSLLSLLHPRPRPSDWATLFRLFVGVGTCVPAEVGCEGVWQMAFEGTPLQLP